MSTLSIGDKRLGSILQRDSYVSDDDLQEAIERQGEVGGRLAEALIGMGVISEHRIARAIEEHIGIPLVSLSRAKINPTATSKIPSKLAQDLKAIPFALDGDRIRVALTDPLDSLTIEEIEDETQLIVEPYTTLSKDFAWALATTYPDLKLTPPKDFTPQPAQPFGTIAREKGFLSPEQLDDALEEQNPHRRITRSHPAK